MHFTGDKCNSKVVKDSISHMIVAYKHCKPIFGGEFHNLLESFFFLAILLECEIILQKC